MSDPQHAWWRGERGEWYEALQAALILLLVLGPSTVAGYPKWPVSTVLLRVFGAILMVAGIILGVAALRLLRPSLTASGALKPDGALVTSGPYRVVRHPLYTAQILFALGWSLAFGGWLTALYALALGVVLNFKARLEERRLVKRFPDYGVYQARTRKFLPFIY